MDNDITVYGTETCHDTRRSRQHLEERGIDYQFVDIDEDGGAEQRVVEWGEGKRKIPVIEISRNGESHRITEPSNDELDRALSSKAA